ncbi:MAG: hypothetical protein KME32_06195 [Mojavia pulchra JT2-VF2]|jgi:hypothetical protein|uniref:Uncharacterized protein n=1 Tax=Mojavia pulchra JT2-VF2 TaxID=287848 RepID=A0A951PXL8_9NOST|nr:hypothetical protein [Mojavia pulchra JT2-VF2]
MIATAFLRFQVCYVYDLARKYIGGVEGDMSVPYEDWLKVGKETLIVFDKTVEQASPIQNTSNYVALYTKRCCLVKMFDGI